MSDSDTNDTVILDDAPIPFVDRTLTQTLNTEVTEDTIIPRKSKTDVTTVPASLKTPTTTFMRSL